MRIISKFRDYYDCIQGMGIDKQNTYIRKKIYVENVNEYPTMLSSRSSVFKAIEPYRIGFCGKFYAVIKTEVYAKNGYDVITNFFYNFDDFIAYYNIYKSKHYNYYSVMNFRDYFGYDMTPFKELFFEYKVPVLVFKYDREQADGYCIVLNDCLRDLNFQHHVDPYTAFQEIAMYRSGVIGCMEADTVNISDKDMKKQKGFGHKYAFKKEPE